MQKNIIYGIVLVVLVGIAGFFGGMQYQILLQQQADLAEET